MENVQPAPQQRAQRRRGLGGATGKGFTPGKSGNPYRMTLTQLWTNKYTDQFREVYRREPTVVEQGLLRTAGSMSAKLERKSPKVTDADGIKAGGLLARTLARLKLDSVDSDSDATPTAYTGPSVSASSLKRRTPRTPSKRSKP